MAFKHDGLVYWCRACDRSQQTLSGLRCIGCGRPTVAWSTDVKGPPPNVQWNLVNGLPADAVRSAIPPQRRGWQEEAGREYFKGDFMSTQGRFDPDRVDEFARRLKAYIRTLDDYDGQVSGALARLGETFDDNDYQELCAEFARTRLKLREMVESSAVEIPRIEAMCADIRANQSISTKAY